MLSKKHSQIDNKQKTREQFWLEIHKMVRQKKISYIWRAEVLFKQTTQTEWT